jgi:histidinol-phosphate aminotransferase
LLADATLNTNENPYSPSPELIQAISDAVFTVASTLNRYPDREATALREVLADYINGQNSTNISMENIWVANGSNEIIQSLFLAFGDKGALGFTPSYSMHPLIAKVSRTQWVDGSRNTDFSLNVDMAVEAILEHKPSLTFITTPNNPTGSAVKITDIEKLADAVKAVGGLLAVDEAYAEFSAERSAATLVKSNPHVVVIRTMSKAFAFAGARVGYLVGDKCIVEAMLLVRLPYHLSALTQAAAQVALEFKDELLGYVSTLIDAREALVLELENLGLTCIESSANFILFTGFRGPGPKLWRELLDKGVLIRDVGLEGYLRVTIGNEAENKLFITALRDLV